jgi:hypothetical protein
LPFNFLDEIDADILHGMYYSRLSGARRMLELKMIADGLDVIPTVRFPNDVSAAHHDRVLFR